jgi:CRP-like cAMP-binding protein
MVVVLSGELVVNRRQPWGETLRLAQTGPGDLLGEMSLLDSGQRFSSCTTLVDSELAVLSAEALDDMLVHDPALAAQLVAILARKLSVRLRAVSSRLGQQTP